MDNSFEAITVRDLIRTLAGRFEHRYGSDVCCIDDKVRQLRALNPDTATAQDVAAIMGNAVWVELECHACGAKPLSVAARTAVDGKTIDFCGECLTAALAKMKSAALSSAG